MMAGLYLGPIHSVPIAAKRLVFHQGVCIAIGAVVVRGHAQDPFHCWIVADVGRRATAGSAKPNQSGMVICHPDFQISVHQYGQDRWSRTSLSNSGVAIDLGLYVDSLGSNTEGNSAHDFYRLESSNSYMWPLGIPSLNFTLYPIDVSRYNAWQAATKIQASGPSSRPWSDNLLWFSVEYILNRDSGVTICQIRSSRHGSTAPVCR